jgi:hypothetical protein
MGRGRRDETGGVVRVEYFDHEPDRDLDPDGDRERDPDRGRNLDQFRRPRP